MKLVSLFQPEPEPPEGGLVGVRRRPLMFLAITNFYASFLILLWELGSEDTILLGPTTMATSVVLALVVLLLRKRWPHLSAWVFIVGTILYWNSSDLSMIADGAGGGVNCCAGERYAGRETRNDQLT